MRFVDICLVDFCVWLFWLFCLLVCLLCWFFDLNCVVNSLFAFCALSLFWCFKLWLEFLSLLVLLYCVGLVDCLVLGLRFGYCWFGILFDLLFVCV